MSICTFKLLLLCSLIFNRDSRDGDGIIYSNL